MLFLKNGMILWDDTICNVVFPLQQNAIWWNLLCYNMFTYPVLQKFKTYFKIHRGELIWKVSGFDFLLIHREVIK